MMPLPHIRKLQDARRSQRYPTSFSGEVAIRHRRLSVTITDIARAGAQVKADHLPSPGEDVLLIARSLEVAATVVWSRDDMAGLRFHWDVEPLEIVRQNASGMRLFRTMRSVGTGRPT